MQAAIGRGGIAPTHSCSRHYMGVSGQHHASAALYPQGKKQEAGWSSELVWTQRLDICTLLTLFQNVR
jgi:hypothetical protein